MEVACCSNVVTDGGVSDAVTLDGLTSDEGDSIAGEEIIPCLYILLCDAGVLAETDLLGPA